MPSNAYREYHTSVPRTSSLLKPVIIKKKDVKPKPKPKDEDYYA